MFNCIENDDPEDQRNQLLSGSRALDGGFIAASLLVLLTLTSTLVAGIGIVSRAAYLEQLSQLVADSAALGVSETSRGLVAGFSCENAEQIAKRFDFELDTCRIVSFGASVEMSKTELGLNFSATSTAGTP